MAYVLTVDQRNSRSNADRVAPLLARLAGLATRLPFERTAGDELQGVLDDETTVVEVALDLVRDGHWHIGIGAGPVQEPLPSSTRAARGPAFELARQAVDAAKRRAQHLAVRGTDERAADDADAVLTVLAALVERRSEAAWEAADLAQSGLSMSAIAAKLGVTRQAVGQRLAAGLWQQEQASRPAAARLLEQAGSASTQALPA
jgi:hypothetical protein